MRVAKVGDGGHNAFDDRPGKIATVDGVWLLDDGTEFVGFGDGPYEVGDGGGGDEECFDSKKGA